MNTQELHQFLIENNKAGYATGNEKAWDKQSDSSTTIPYQQGDWKSHDNFFGGEPYGGRLVVFYKDKPVWIMVYYGWVEQGVDSGIVYPVLQNALKHMPDEAPLRGPSLLEYEGFVYTNTWQGNVERYSGTEVISKDGKELYRASYMGGLVDQ